MRHSSSPPGVKIKPFGYESFGGLDTSRDIAAMDVGTSQVLTTLTNGYVDWTGQIVRDPAARHVIGQAPVVAVKHLSADAFVYAESRESGIALASSRDHVLEDAFAPGSPISTVVFGGKAYLAAPGQPPVSYDGTLWRRIGSGALKDDPPAYLTGVNLRLCCAGLARFPTMVWLSRVNVGEVMPPDEDPEDENVLRAGYIDIRNMINSGDIITGIGGFEWNRLAIFTSSQVLVYAISPNLNEWEISDQVAVNVGCISHNTIALAGRELLFCSKQGVHAISRSQYNGVSIYSRALSRRIEPLYRQLVAQVSDLKSISASWDEDTSRYHIYFPVNETTCYRMSVVVEPGGDRNQSDTEPFWSIGTYLNARCADTLAGELLIGTPGGVYSSYDIGQDVLASAPEVDFEMRTPILWLGSLSETKSGYSYTLMASGEGQIQVEFTNEDGELLQSDVLEFEDSGEHINELTSESLSAQFERKLEVRFRGIRVRIRTSGLSLVRITGFAINIRV